MKDAVYISVAPNEIVKYIENLYVYMKGVLHSSFKEFNKTDEFRFDKECDPIIKDTVMHAQFESIHPFLDGNGRLGRILIALIAIKEALLDVPLFFITACGRMVDAFLNNLQATEELAVKG